MDNSSASGGSQTSTSSSKTQGTSSTKAGATGGATNKASTSKRGSGGSTPSNSSATKATGGTSESTDTASSAGGNEATTDVADMGGKGGATGKGGASSKRSSNSVTTGGKPGNGGGGGANAGGTKSGSSGGATAGGSAAGGAAAGGSSSDTAPTSCPSTVLKAGDAEKKIGSRAYILHVPAKYTGTTSVPLIIDFHGITGSGSGERTSSPYPAQTDPDGAIMAFPTGASGPMGNAWNVGPCCVANVDDVAFAKAIVADIQKVACIDPKRVYAVGFSMGGGLSHYLACHASDVFAAVAPAAFDLLKENVDACKPKRPITVVSFRGTSDSIVSYAGGYSSVVQGMPITFLGAKATFQKWAELNQCSGSASAEDGKGCSSYSGCKDGVDVVLCTKQGGGHEAGNASVAWPILKKHVMP